MQHLDSKIQTSSDRIPGEVLPFRTFRDGHLRTVGLVVLLPGHWPSLSEWGESEAQTLSRTFDPFHEGSGATARDKLAFVSNSTPIPAVACYQTKGRSAGAIFCGNATAASHALLASYTGNSRVVSSVECGSLVVEAESKTVAKGDQFETSQVWKTPPPPPFSFGHLFGQRAAEIQWLNHYHIIEGPLAKGELEFITVTGAGRSLASRVAIIDQIEGSIHVRFYNSNGLHGSAPHTGLLTLALARDSVPWIGSMLAKSVVITPAGPETLPVACSTRSSHVFELPSVTVRLGNQLIQ